MKARYLIAALALLATPALAKPYAWVSVSARRATLLDVDTLKVLPNGNHSAWFQIFFAPSSGDGAPGARAVQQVEFSCRDTLKISYAVVYDQSGLVIATPAPDLTFRPVVPESFGAMMQANACQAINPKLVSQYNDIYEARPMALKLMADAPK